MEKFLVLTMALDLVGFILVGIGVLRAAGILLLLFGIFLLVIAIALLIKIWSIDQNSDGAKLIRLVNRANKGHPGAQAECNNHPFVNKRMVYRKGEACTLYKASPEVYGWL